MKPQYPIRRKKPKAEDEEGLLKKFKEMLSKLQVSILFHEILELTPKYVIFMKEFLSMKNKSSDFETVALKNECGGILKRKLPPNLEDPRKFTIPCTIEEVKIPHALCDMGASIDLMARKLAKKLNLGEPKPINMTLTLANLSITYLYGIIEDVLVKVDGLVFLNDFVIVDMNEDTNASLILKRIFLEMRKAMIDVESG